MIVKGQNNDHKLLENAPEYEIFLNLKENSKKRKY